jgi:hypothetical protein
MLYLIIFIGGLKLWEINFSCIAYFRTKLAQIFEIEDIAHMMLPRSEVINSYVVEVSSSSYMWLFAGLIFIAMLYDC